MYLILNRGWLGCHIIRGFQRILYDHESDTLLVCDAGRGKIIKVDPATGNKYLFSAFSNLIITNIHF